MPRLTQPSHLCLVCGQRFFLETNLTRHLDSSHGPPNFKQELCSELELELERWSEEDYEREQRWREEMRFEMLLLLL